MTTTATPDTNFAARADYAASPRTKGDWTRYVTRVEAIRAADTGANARRAAQVRADRIRNARLIALDPATTYNQIGH